MVFMSYRRKTGIDLARLITYTLQQNSYEVFLDIDTIQNGKWSKQIENSLKNSTDYVLLITKNEDLLFSDITNDWYYKEIEFAINSEKNIIVVLTPEVNHNAITLPESISSLKEYQAINYNPMFF